MVGEGKSTAGVITYETFGIGSFRRLYRYSKKSSSTSTMWTVWLTCTPTP